MNNENNFNISLLTLNPKKKSNSEINNTGTTRNVDIMSNNKTDWKKSISDKLIRRIVRHRENRIDSIRMNKEEILNEIRYEEMLSDHMDDELLQLSEYFDKFVNLFESEGEYQLETMGKWNISVCPKCFYPMVFAAGRATCLNLCFQYSLPDDLINEYFTLDNFMDMIITTLKLHSKCLEVNNDVPEVLIFDDDLTVVCPKCFKEDLYS
jgi:hypothetical protein